MRLLCIILLAFLVASCNEKIDIKTAESGDIGVNEPYLRTTKIEPYEAAQETANEPKIDILSPKDGEVINGSTIIVKLNVSNFRLVPPDRYPKPGQGHVQVLVDNMEFRSSKTEFIFENESNGTHTIKAELMLSNNTVLHYSKTIGVFLNTT